MSLRILLIGSGGREHALARALRRSASCAALYCAPGNPGIESEATCVTLDVNDHGAVITWCRENTISLVVVGPEQPLAAGIADSLRGAGLAVFGPSASAARIETSKGFAKDLMQRAGVPTAAYRRFDGTQVDEAVAYVSTHSTPVVIKADGLAAGKGVVIAEATADAEETVRDMFAGAFGSSGSSIVVESFLVGEEASLFAVCDGERYVALAPAQDHKRIGDCDTGKNTGGMGAYAPAPLVTPDVHAWACTHIIEPTLAALRTAGSPFIGCLFAGLMVHEDGTSSVVEFNCRFGDPETQSVMSVLDADVAALFNSAAHGTLDVTTINRIAAQHACTVVMASGGYPDSFTTGHPIHGLDTVHGENVIVYHAGTKRVGNDIFSSGGRVLGVTGLGSTLRAARDAAYAAVERITFEREVHRSDIGAKGLRRLGEQP
jgi:phosphoribosylamine--glycine ligase